LLEKQERDKIKDLVETEEELMEIEIELEETTLHEHKKLSSPTSGYGMLPMVVIEEKKQEDDPDSEKPRQSVEIGA